MPKKPPKKPAKTSKKPAKSSTLSVVSKIEDAREKKASKKKPKSDIVREIEETIMAAMDGLKTSMSGWKPVSGTIPFGLMLDAGLVSNEDNEIESEYVDSYRRTVVPPVGSLDVIGFSVMCQPGQYRVKKISVLDKILASNVDAATFRTHKHVGEFYPMEFGVVNATRPIVLEVALFDEVFDDQDSLSITFYGRPVVSETE